MNLNIIENVYKIDDPILNDCNRSKKVVASLKDLVFNGSTINKIAEIFYSEMTLALSENPSSLQMENTYIPELIDGTEDGTFLALDLGSTNFRVIQLDINHGHILHEEVKHYHISDELRLDSGLKLFDYLAECVIDFVNEKKLNNHKNLALGFTFSFPMKQHSLHSAELITWTKSFNCPAVVNKDVVMLLSNSLKKYGQHNIEVVAILNDTTGTLVKGASMDKNTKIGMIVGTGSNACYMEKADRVKHWETQRHGEKCVIIDIEWGAFGDNGIIDFIKTPFDIQLDTDSLMTSSFTFEKYIGGKFLGELVRIVMEHLVKQKLLFINASIKLFPKSWTFSSDNISIIEQDTVDLSTNNTEKIFENLGYKYNIDYDIDDIKIIQYIAALISIRASRLISICLAVLLTHINEENVTIAVDGSVYKHHPRLKLFIENFIKELVKKDNSFQLILAEDGSGLGAGLVAAIAQKLRSRSSD